jgi:hypothetical protein
MLCSKSLKIQHAYNIENIRLACAVYSHVMVFVQCKLIGILYYFIWFWHSVPEQSDSSATFIWTKDAT